MTVESVLLGILQWLISPLILLLVGWFLNRKINETKKEITNSHPQHLRDDLDSKFKLVFAKLDTIVSEQRELDTKHSKHAEDVALIFDELAQHEARLTGQAGKLRRVTNGK
jgi:glutathionyl-hydroquinone reductase